MSGLPTDQVLAIVRLRQWSEDRATVKGGRVARYSARGWRDRRSRDNDAQLVRVLDFELAFQHLGQDEQIALAAVYRDGHGHRAAAVAVGCTHRQLAYLLPAARQHLADILDRLDLL